MVLKDTKEGQGGEHYGKKQGRRILYGLVGAVMAATAIGSVAAKESKPYDAPELRLAKGMEDYNLLEGITYNENKYELEIADEGQFDIDTLGKYEVEYALIPVDPEETAQKTTGTAGGAGSGAGTGSAAGAGSVEESTVAEESSGVEESTGETDAAESTESTETTETTTSRKTTGPIFMNFTILSSSTPHQGKQIPQSPFPIYPNSICMYQISQQFHPRKEQSPRHKYDLTM